MVSLVDIVPQTRTVALAAGELTLHPLGLRQIADLFLRYPGLRNVFTESAPELDVAALLRMVPDAVAAIIAEAARQPEAAEAVANGALTLDEVAECLSLVRELTAPGGIGPLMARLARLLGEDFVGGIGRVPGTSAPLPPNNSLAQDMSPQP
jgi:hypothetical protein